MEASLAANPIRTSTAVTKSHTEPVGGGIVRQFTLADIPVISEWMEDASNFFHRYDEHSATSHLLDQYVVATTSDPHGLFTLQKYFLVYEKADRIHACVGISHKRGGSTKIGPFLLAPEAPKGSRIRIAMTVARAAVDDARRLGRRKVYATVSASNVGFFKILEAFGGACEAKLSNQYQEGSDETVWALRLDDTNEAAAGSVVTSALGVPEEKFEATAVSPYGNSDKAFLEGQFATLAEWHSDVDETFTDAMVSAHARGRNGTRLDFQEKCAAIFVARQSGRPVGLTIATRKRGGALKAYPLFGSRDVQTALLSALHKVGRENRCRKLYTYCHETDSRQYEWLTSMGFRSCGLIRAPYKAGHNLFFFECALDELGNRLSTAPAVTQQAESIAA